MSDKRNEGEVGPSGHPHPPPHHPPHGDHGDDDDDDGNKPSGQFCRKA